MLVSYSILIISRAELLDEHNTLLFVLLKIAKFPYYEFFRKRICDIISIIIAKLKKDMLHKTDFCL